MSAADLRKLLKALETQGFTVARTQSNHWLVRKEGKAVTTLASTPSDHRSWQNGLAALRRAGFTWPPPK